MVRRPADAGNSHIGSARLVLRSRRSAAAAARRGEAPMQTIFVMVKCELGRAYQVAVTRWRTETVPVVRWVRTY